MKRLRQFEDIVNGKPAIDWVMERQAVKVDKDSGIVNDAKDYAISVSSRRPPRQSAMIEATPLI